MKLYYFPVAPNPTKVRVFLREKGIELEEVLVDFRTREQRAPEHLARNPLGRVPVLELDNGAHVTESLTIMELLEEMHPEPALIGRNPLERARVRAIERIVELNIQVPISRIVHTTNSPLGYQPNPAIAEAETRGLPRLFALIDGGLARQAFVAGDVPTIADCTLYAALNFGRMRDVVPDAEYVHVHRWFGEFSARPSVVSLE